MSEQLKESLSAVMDGEADEFEIRRVLNEAENDPELRGVWERYHLVSSVMRGEGRMLRADRLSARFWTQIDAGDDAAAADDTTSPAPRAANKRGAWLPRIAGLAVAAGVAAAVLIAFRTGENVTVPPATVAMVERSSQPAFAPFDTQTMRAGAMPTALDLQRAHAYMLHHAHHVALNNRSVVPFVKVAAFESR